MGSTTTEPTSTNRATAVARSFRSLPRGWQTTVAVLSLLALLGLVSGSSDAELTAMQEENERLRVRLAAARDTPAETVTEVVTERVTESVTVTPSPAPAVTETVTERVTETAVVPPPPPPEPEPVAEPQPPAPAGGCHPAYSGACVPDVAGDLNCDDIAATGFASIGSDPYRLDGDGDGVACEG